MKKEKEKGIVVRELTDEVYESVVDELEAMVVQKTKDWRETQMRVYWETGDTLRKAEKDHGVNITKLVARLADDNRMTQRQMSDRLLWECLKFRDVYPDFEKVYDTDFGENISWSKVRKLILPSKPQQPPTLAEIAGKIFRKLGVEETKKLIDIFEKLIKSSEE